MKPIALLILVLFFTTLGLCQKNQKVYPLVSFKELGKASTDTICLKGYVLDVYICPPCPPGMICKPCMENHFMIVEKKPVDIMKIPLEDRVRIFSDQPKDLVVGKQYLFTVRFKNKKASPLDNLELISFSNL